MRAVGCQADGSAAGVAMNFCNQCGAQLRENARFCDRCGTPIRAQVPAAVPAPPAASPPPSPGPLEGVQAQNTATPILVCRRSILTYLLQPLPWILWAAVIAAIVVTVFWPALWYAVPVALLVAAGSFGIWWINHRGDHLTVYADRIVRHEGVLNRTEVVNPLWRVQNVTIKQKWYGFGWIYIETAGEDSDQGFGPMRDAARVRDVIYHLMRPQD